MTDEDASVVMYSDYVCPFCYLGRESLESYRGDREQPLAIDWRPFDLRHSKRGPEGEIDHSVDDGKDEDYFEKVRENVARLRDQYDADEMLSLDEIPEVDSLNAQIVSLAVRRDRPDDWEAFDRAVFDALWVDGRDIGDEEVLVDVAEDIGIPSNAVREALADDDLRRAVFDAFQSARQAGVTGVPTFVYNEYAARGAVPPEHLRRLVEGE